MSRTPARRAPSPRKRGEVSKKIRIDIVVQSARWRRQRGAAAIVKKAVLAAARTVSTRAAGLAIVLCDDSAIRALNRKWRGKNAPTNVLSFPAAEPAGTKADGAKRRGPPHIGDIVIAYGTTAREAGAEGKPLPHHLAHLAVHGFLHLIGHDHDNDPDADRMERLERRILARLGIPDPYHQRD